MTGPFYTNASSKPRLAPGDLPFAIGVDESPGGKLVGVAYPIGHVGGWDWRADEENGPPEATWRLAVDGEDLEGRFALRSGRFGWPRMRGRGGLSPETPERRHGTIARAVAFSGALRIEPDPSTRTRNIPRRRTSMSAPKGPVLASYNCLDEAAVGGFRYVQRCVPDYVNNEYVFYLFPRKGMWTYSTPEQGTPREVVFKIKSSYGAACHTHRPGAFPNFSPRDRDSFLEVHKHFPGVWFYLLDGFGQIRYATCPDDLKVMAGKDLAWLNVDP
jgi:hypothetical protein